MKVKYTNSREDYIKAYERFRKLSLRFTSIRLVASMTGLIIVGLYYMYEMSFFYNIGIGVYLFIVVMLYSMCIFFIIIESKISKKNISKVVDKLIELRTDTIGEKSAEIIEDKIICKCKFSQVEYNIKAFDNIFEISGVLAVCIEKTNPMIIIPCSSFESEDEKNEFINIIKEKSNYIK